MNDFASAASIAGTRNTDGAAPVTATRTPFAVSATITPTTANFDARCANFSYAARFGRRDVHRGHDLVALERRLEQALEEVLGRDLAPVGRDRRAERDERRRIVRRRIGVRDRAADRAAVADLRVADPPGERRERRDELLDRRRLVDLGVGDERADREFVRRRRGCRVSSLIPASEIRSLGSASSSFSTGNRLWPPDNSFASGLCFSSATASATVLGR